MGWQLFQQRRVPASHLPAVPHLRPLHTLSLHPGTGLLCSPGGLSRSLPSSWQRAWQVGETWQFSFSKHMKYIFMLKKNPKCAARHIQCYICAQRMAASPCICFSGGNLFCVFIVNYSIMAREPPEDQTIFYFLMKEINSSAHLIHLLITGLWNNRKSA